jgi:hypothetical protein
MREIKRWVNLDEELSIAAEGGSQLQELLGSDPTCLRDFAWVGIELVRVDIHDPPVENEIAVIGWALPHVNSAAALKRKTRFLLQAVRYLGKSI